MSLFGRHFEPADGFAPLLPNPFAVGVELPEDELRLGAPGGGRGLVPEHRFRHIGCRAPASIADSRQAQHRRGVTEPRRVAETRLRRRVILRQAVAAQIEETEVEARAGIVLARRLPEQCGGAARIALDRLTRDIHQPECGLRRVVVLLGSQCVKPRRSREIDGNPEPVRIDQAEAVLALGASLRGGQFIPIAGFGIVPGAAQSPQIQRSEIGLRLGSPLRCREPAPAQRLGIIGRHGNPGREPHIPVPFGRLPIAAPAPPDTSLRRRRADREDRSG